ncbi:MAG: TIGR02147 family protein [Cyclobacteriaceae bacterium]
MIFDFLEYRPYLEQRLGKKGSRTGMRKKLAEHMNVHTTFVSQVLLGKADFSMEQAEQTNLFLGHSEEEGEYFLYLVLRHRAGNEELRNRFDTKIRKMREARLNIKDRLQAQDSIKQEDKLKFYSNHYFGAVHVLVSIDKFRTVEALAEALKLSRVQVQEMVEFLIRLGIVIEEKGKLAPGPQHVHIGTDSELVLKHHSNWRMHALSSLQFVNKDDLHYSACLSISKKDAFKVKDSILANLQDNVKIISASPEEAAFVYNIDFYSLV